MAAAARKAASQAHRMADLIQNVAEDVFTLPTPMPTGARKLDSINVVLQISKSVRLGQTPKMQLVFDLFSRKLRQSRYLERKTN